MDLIELAARHFKKNNALSHCKKKILWISDSEFGKYDIERSRPITQREKQTKKTFLYLIGCAVTMSSFHRAKLDCDIQGSLHLGSLVNRAQCQLR